MIIEESVASNGVTIKTVTVEPSDLSSEEQKTLWQSNCNTCQHKVEDTCGKCGCLLVTLMTYKTAQCPIGVW